MSYEFKRLSDVEALTEVPEGANALVEIDGIIKRVPGSGLGGDTGIKTAIIKHYDYNYAVNIATGAIIPKMAMGGTYECLNMSFEEAYNILSNYEVLDVTGMLAQEDGPFITHGTVSILTNQMNAIPCIGIFFSNGLIIFWTELGISEEPPYEDLPPS